MITAEELCIKCSHVNLSRRVNPKDIIEFTKFHVEAALKAANERVEIHSDSSSNYYREFEEGIRNRTIWVPANSILNAYPLDLIK